LGNTRVRWGEDLVGLEGAGQVHVEPRRELVLARTRTRTRVVVVIVSPVGHLEPAQNGLMGVLGWSLQAEWAYGGMPIIRHP
jgi:hypothetical protein